MSYNQQAWINGQGGNTPLSGSRLQHMEDGIFAAQAIADAAATGVTVFSTVKYPAVFGDDRPRVVSAVNDAVSAMMLSGNDQIVLIHAPLTFTTGVTKAALGTTIDALNLSFAKQGVPLPTNLPAVLHIMFAPNAKITLSANCVTAFYIDKLVDYDVFQNVSFYNAWVDGANQPLSLASPAWTSHALIGNMPNYGSVQRYLSFQDINFFGLTKFTNMYWNAAGNANGQLGIGFFGDHNTPLEATQTFSKNIYLRNGYQRGGFGLFYVCSIAATRSRPGGVNHYHDGIDIGRYRCIIPSVSTDPTNHSFNGIFITGAGFGDRCYIGPGYVENIGDCAIEVGTMQQVDIVVPRSKDPFYQGILLRQTHAPIDVNSQKITIRGLRCEVTSAISSQTFAFAAPVRIFVDDQVIVLTCTASGGTFTLTVPGVNTTAAIARNAASSAVVSALAAIGLTNTTASGGPLGTAPMTVRVSQVNLTAPITFTSSLTGGSLTLDLAPSNASFGTVTVEDAVFTAAGLTFSKQQRADGLFFGGLDQPHKRVEIIRPTIILKDYTYDYATDSDLILMHPNAQYTGWGNVAIKDTKLVLAGTCQFHGAAGFGALYEVLVDGAGTIVDVDGMESDRAAAVNGNMRMIGAGKNVGDHISVIAKRLNPTNFASAGNRGVSLFSTGTVRRFDITESDFSKGTDNNTSAFDLSAASAANASNAHAAHNTFITAVPGATITVTASPFTFSNRTGMTAIVEVFGGTVSLIERGDRDATFTSSLFASGTFTVDAGAYLRITYSVAPTMKYVLLS